MKKSKIYKKAIEAVMDYEMFTSDEKLEIVKELIDKLSYVEYCEKKEADENEED